MFIMILFLPNIFQNKIWKAIKKILLVVISGGEIMGRGVNGLVTPKPECKLAQTE